MQYITDSTFTRIFGKPYPTLKGHGSAARLQQYNRRLSVALCPCDLRQVEQGIGGVGVPSPKRRLLHLQQAGGAKGLTSELGLSQALSARRVQQQY